MFRDAFKRRRRIIPASGIYERTSEKGSKVPHLVSAADGSPVLAFPGLWDRWRDKATGKEMLSTTIIVSGTSARMEPYHDHMPVLLTPEQVDPWLVGEAGPEILRPAAESASREWIVSARVNRTGQGDDPTLTEASYDVMRSSEPGIRCGDGALRHLAHCCPAVILNGLGTIGGSDELDHQNTVGCPGRRRRRCSRGGACAAACRCPV